LSEFSTNRRTLVISGAAVVAALGLGARGGSAAPIIQSGGGITGGGSVQTDTESPAEFSVFGSRFAVEGSDTPLFVGSLSYLDVTGQMTIESVSVSTYGPVEGAEETTRQMTGIATVNGEGAYPFNAILTDGGPIGTGSDMFELGIGNDGETEVTEPSYLVQSSVQSGNLQLIDFDFSSLEVSATPAG
jgi:hypothetical protein